MAFHLHGPDNMWWAGSTRLSIQRFGRSLPIRLSKCHDHPRCSWRPFICPYWLDIPHHSLHCHTCPPPLACHVQITKPMVQVARIPESVLRSHSLHYQHSREAPIRQGAAKDIYRNAVTISSHLCAHWQKFPELIKQHNETVRELEKLVLKHMGGDEMEAYRPTIRVGGCCGMGGRRVDAIKFYTYVSTLCQPNTKIKFPFSSAGLQIEVEAHRSCCSLPN